MTLVFQFVDMNVSKVDQKLGWLTIDVDVRDGGYPAVGCDTIQACAAHSML